MSYKNHHHHNQVTGVHSGGSHHHNHGSRLYPQVVTTPYSPTVQVTSRRPQIAVVSPSPYRQHYYSGGPGVVLVGSLVLLPIIIVAVLFNLTMGFTAASTTAGIAGAGAAGALGLNLATFGLGGLVLYGALGLVSIYSSAKECYDSNKNVFEMIKSRVVNDDGLTFKGIIKSAGAVLWSPFLLIGGLAGMGVKAAMRTRSSISPSSENQGESIGITGSYSDMGNVFTPGNTASSRNERNPTHYRNVLADSTELPDLHLLDSQTSFTYTIKN
ncbi:hypothetical protein [Legionella sp. PC997]|uniref:hypothetical protein n=1 Tax=Legionella sp. PC997 TaxID=2755562 RepID=UPI0015FC2E7A|nr:hypothetical protein [Legionella sp. PC997]QMT59683.1 hypothetical protein HBNCFIEN_01049 [Legionella sp. PC997]